MKKLSLLYFFLTLFSQPVSSQHIHRVIYYQSSGGKTASGVQVFAFGANTEYTNDNGMFSLYFSNKQPGDKVKILVGDGKLASKAFDNRMYNKALLYFDIRNTKWFATSEQATSQRKC